MYEEDKDRNWNREPEEERPKKGGILKKAAWITAGALLFGTIAGGVMVGVQIASSGVFKNLYAIVSGEPEAGDWKAPEGQKPPADPFAGPETATPPYIRAVISAMTGFSAADWADRPMRCQAADRALLSGKMRQSFSL